LLLSAFILAVPWLIVMRWEGSYARSVSSMANTDAITNGRCVEYFNNESLGVTDAFPPDQDA